MVSPLSWGNSRGIRREPPFSNRTECRHPARFNHLTALARKEFRYGSLPIYRVRRATASRLRLRVVKTDTAAAGTRHRLQTGGHRPTATKKLNTDVFPERLVIGRRWADPPIESEGV